MAPTVAESRMGEAAIPQRIESDRTVLPSEATQMARQRGDGAYFFVKSGPELATTFPLESVTTIGRSSGCDIRLSDRRVSGLHAHVRSSRGQYIYQDLEATNHSYLIVGQDARRIRGPHTLIDGDEIRLGTTVLKFIAPVRGRSR